jgi:heat shock protein HslJ
MKHLFIAVLVLFFAACNTQTNKSSNQQDSLPAPTENNLSATATITTLEGAWQLQAVLPSDTATGKIPTLVFDLKSKKFQGNTGCNNMSGNFYTEGDSLSFNEQILMTKMACPGYNEQGFIESLTKTDRYKIDKGVLQLMQEQTILSKWIRKDSVVQKKI